MDAQNLNKKLPRVSIIVISWNVERTLPTLLKSISDQNYPQSKYEILLVDGNSTDRTLEIAKNSKLPLRIVKSKHPNDPEACRSYGIHAAKYEILGFMDADNYMPHNNWLRKMMEPFMNHPELYGVQTLRYGYRKKDTALNRYFALLGAADPVGFYLNKDDRLSYLYDKWNLYGKIEKEYKNYFLIRFSPDLFPTVGCNGFFFRKKIAMKTKITPATFFHIDTPYDLAKLGYNLYAVVNDTVIHDTAGSFLSFLRKRARYMGLHYMSRSNKRRYKVFDPKRPDDIFNLAKFILFSITFIEPLIFSIRGYRKIKDPVWFIHPLFCFSITMTYGFMVAYGFVQFNIIRKLQMSN